MDKDASTLKAEFHNIVNMWIDEFPQLTRYSATKLYIKAECVLIGLWLWRSSAYHDNYKVMVTIDSLWDEDIRILSLRELKDNKGRNRHIRFSASKTEFDKTIESTKKQFGDVLNTEISITNLLKFLDDELADYKFTKHNPNSLCGYFKTKLAIAEYFKIESLKTETIKELDYEIQFWDDLVFQYHYGSTIAEWKASLIKQFENREQFLTDIHKKLSKPKIAKLNSAKILVPKEINFKFKKPCTFITYYELMKRKWRYYKFKRNNKVELQKMTSIVRH